MNKMRLMFGGMVGLGLLSFGCAAFSANEANASRKMIQGATDRISRMSRIDIDQGIVDKAVGDAIYRKSAEAVNRAAKSAENRMMNDIQNRVRQAIEKSAGNINERVARKIAQEMASVERDEIMNEVIKKTTEALVEKLGDELDGEVGRIGKIYQGIAAAIG